VDAIADKSQEIKNSKRRMGVWFGLVGGLVFSLVLWGIDGFGLAAGNAYLPWAKLAMGLIPAVGIYTLVAWISARAENGVWAFIVWLLGGFAVCYTACRLPFEGLTLFYKVFDPAIAARVNYPFNDGTSAHVFIVMGICIVVNGVLGILFTLLPDNAANASAKGGVLIPLLIWSFFFLAEASVIDVEVQQRLRSPVQAVNLLVDRKIASETNPVSKEEARRLHLSSMNTVLDLLHEPRKLVLSGYDSTLIQTNVLVNFNGSWVECIAIADQSADPPVQQVIYCRTAE
jgi:hypothetical protein